MFTVELTLNVGALWQTAEKQLAPVNGVADEYAVRKGLLQQRPEDQPTKVKLEQKFQDFPRRCLLDCTFNQRLY